VIGSELAEVQARIAQFTSSAMKVSWLDFPVSNELGIPECLPKHFHQFSFAT
jgi:hypothetical protein